uniref:NADH dehydrogenase subunit 3 n=1 Tax=Leucauge wulingensis TaxID=2918496 RepID=UPI001FA7E50C|nr:NADH dehydrogenase subunit 3 [Leucauge wulingensis]ULD67697.1 NADH dehydrogenase subunit 3 [Leucauge wulingensis]
MGMSMILVMLIYFIFFLISYKIIYDFESSSVYECGFEINSGTRSVFSYRFFLISVLFLIFDVEIVLMLPTPLMYSSMFFLLFVMILIMGLIYEFYCGSLEWL